MAKKIRRLPIDLGERIREIPSHTEPLGPESRYPITHYRRAVNANFAMIDYIEGNLDRKSRDTAIEAEHMRHLRRFVLANLIETFERFIKELAAVCIDQLSGFVTDDRYNVFNANGSEVIAHFEAGSIGKALCESDTWLSNSVINTRFRKLLAPSDRDIWDEFLLPAKNQGTADQRQRAMTLAILWQVRHNLTHNSGVLTGSDTMKLRVLTRRDVMKGQVLIPSEEDLRCVKQFLTETAEDINSRVGRQLAVLLTAIHEESATLLDPQFKANEVANIFDLSLNVSAATASPAVV